MKTMSKSLGFYAFCKEDEFRINVIKAMLANNKASILPVQKTFARLANETNKYLHPIIKKNNKDNFIAMCDFSTDVDKSVYKYFLLLLAYFNIKRKDIGYYILFELKAMLYFEIIKWYYNNNNKVNFITRLCLFDDINNSTFASVYVRNVLSGREDLNVIFNDFQFNLIFKEPFSLMYECFIRDEILDKLKIAAAIFLDSRLKYFVYDSIAFEFAAYNIIIDRYEFKFTIRDVFDEMHEIGLITFPNETNDKKNFKEFFLKIISYSEQVQQEFTEYQNSLQRQIK